MEVITTEKFIKKIHHKYCDNYSRAHCIIAINSNDYTIKLVESFDD